MWNIQVSVRYVNDATVQNSQLFTGKWKQQKEVAFEMYDDENCLFHVFTLGFNLLWKKCKFAAE